jgi:hypothetical protein
VLRAAALAFAGGGAETVIDRLEAGRDVESLSLLRVALRELGQLCAQEREAVIELRLEVGPREAGRRLDVERGPDVVQDLLAQLDLDALRTRLKRRVGRHEDRGDEVGWVIGAAPDHAPDGLREEQDTSGRPACAGRPWAISAPERRARGRRPAIRSCGCSDRCGRRA